MCSSFMLYNKYLQVSYQSAVTNTLCHHVLGCGSKACLTPLMSDELWQVCIYSPPLDHPAEEHFSLPQESIQDYLIIRIIECLGIFGMQLFKFVQGVCKSQHISFCFHSVLSQVFYGSLSFSSSLSSKCCLGDKPFSRYSRSSALY